MYATQQSIKLQVAPETFDSIDNQNIIDIQDDHFIISSSIYNLTFLSLVFTFL